MKVTITLATTYAVLCTAMVNAQSNPPKPPTPPVVSSHSDTTSSTTSSSYSITQSDDDANKGGNISISISDNSSNYSLSAKYPNNRNKDVSDVIRKELGEGEKVGNNKFRWVSNVGGEEVYKVDLKNGKLAIALDKDEADEDLIAKFKNMGKLVRNAISGKDVDAEREAQHLQREADRLQRSADRMRRESERMQREAERLKIQQDRLKDQQNRNASRYERDAARLAEQGMRMAEEADALSRNAANGGGVSTMVNELLNTASTKMPSPFVNMDNWTWPNAQNVLLQKLKTDALITSDTEVVFARDRTGIFVNGTKMSMRNQMNYSRLLNDNGITMNNFFTFYKKGNHIVIVDDRARIEPLLRDLKRKGFINDIDDKVNIAINGATVSINGESQGNQQISQINSLLNKHNIIGAPGKTVKVSSEGNYTLGYSADKKHLGTWVSND